MDITKRQYYRGDLMLSKSFYRKNDNNEKIAIAVPNHIKIEYFTAQMKGVIVVERYGSVCKNCELTLDGKQLKIALPLSRYDIGMGELLSVITEYQNDNLFPNKIKEVKIPVETGIILWRGESDSDNIVIEEQVLSSFLYGYSAYQLAVKYGYKGTEEEFAKAWIPIDINKYLKITDAEVEFSTLKTANTKIQQSLSSINDVLSEQRESCRNVKESLNSFTSRMSSELLAYCKKDETFNKEEVLEKLNALTDLITRIPKFSIDVVESLPTADIKENILYFVANKKDQKNNSYSEYIYHNGKWELLGDSNIDLSGYLTREEGHFYFAPAGGSSSRPYKCNFLELYSREDSLAVNTSNFFVSSDPFLVKNLGSSRVTGVSHIGGEEAEPVRVLSLFPKTGGVLATEDLLKSLKQEIENLIEVIKLDYNEKLKGKVNNSTLKQEINKYDEKLKNTVSMSAYNSLSDEVSALSKKVSSFDLRLRLLENLKFQSGFSPDPVY